MGSSWLGQAMRAGAFRLAALYVALFVLAAAAIAGLLAWRASAIMSAETLAASEGEALALAEVARAAGPAALRAAVEARSSGQGGSLYLLADPAGRKIAGNLSRLPPELGTGESGLFRYHAFPPGDGGEWLAVGTLVAVGEGARLVVGRDLEEQRRFLDDARWWFVGGFGLLALAGLGGGLLLARAIGRRVDTITAASERIMAGALSDRLPVSGRGDEIDALARQVNVMLDRIEQLLASLKEVSDNIAHDLKTPINRLRNRAEAALGDGQGAEAWRAGLERTIEEADQIIKTFNALLLISRIEAGALEESLTTFDLGDLVGDVAELYEPVAEEAGLGLEREIAAGVVVRANRQLLGQALANLLDNAIKYGLPSAIARPRLRIEVARRGSQVHLVVADQGPGIPAADRARAVERFIRLDRSRTRPGTGLGLSLVAAVARMHGGRLELEDNAPGLRVVVLLPQAQTGRVPESAGEARVGP